MKKIRGKIKFNKRNKKDARNSPSLAILEGFTPPSRGEVLAGNFLSFGLGGGIKMRG